MAERDRREERDTREEREKTEGERRETREREGQNGNCALTNNYTQVPWDFRVIS